MIPKEIFKKVRQIEIKTSHLVNNVFAGQYHSAFKGQGIEFDEVREYQMGDDIRSIDWNVTARSGKPFVKKFIEERELTVMILVDASESMTFSSSHGAKNQLAAEIAALLAFAAIRNNDNVGLIIFTDRVEKFIPPRKGSRHVLRVIREVLYFKPKGKQTNVLAALDYLNKITTRKTISFILSDFFDANLQNDSFKRTLAASRKRHDIIPITFNDRLEKDLPDTGLVNFKDGETGKEVCIDTSSLSVRREFIKQNIERLQKRKQIFLSAGLDFIDVQTQANYADDVVQFFTRRNKRIR